MAEKISQPISDDFIVKISSTRTTSILDMNQITEEFKDSIVGTNHGFNYIIHSLYISYNLQSLIEKPYQEFDLGTPERQQIAEDLEYERKHNELKIENGQHFSSRIYIIKKKGDLSVPVGDKLLFNTGRNFMNLLPYLQSPIIGKNSILQIELSNFNNSSDTLTVAGCWSGNCNHIFDGGTKSLALSFP